MSDEKWKAPKISFKTSFFQALEPEAIGDAIERADLNKVIHLITSGKVSVDFVYVGCTPLFRSINLRRDSITLFLLDKHANPNAEFNFRPQGTIIQDIMRRKDLNNTQLLILYGAVPLLTNLRINFATSIVATSAYIDFKKRCALEAQLETTLKQENRQKKAAELCEQLANFWEEQAKINQQFPRGNPTYQSHYQAKAAKYRQQKKQLLASLLFPVDKKGFFV